jgi:DNA-binding GntR family transcriptional regulator
VQALRELEHRDLVVRVQGSGTFKASPTPGSFTRSLDAGKLPSFSEDLERAGHVTREQIARCARAAADHETAAALAIEPGAPIWRIERTVLADERPVVHIVSALRADRYPEIDADAIAQTSLYAFLEQRYGPDGRPTWADEEYSALNATPELCATLAVPVDRAILGSRRVAYLADGQAVELVHSYMRADAYRVRVTLLPGEGDASAARELELRAELPSGGTQA